MNVFLLQNVEKIGMAGEIVKVSDGFASNFLIPKKLAVMITPENETAYKRKAVSIENRKEAIATKTSMLAEKIKALRLVLKRKLHDNGKLYGSVSPCEIVDLLSEQGIAIAKNQVLFDKAIKEKGSYEVTIKLSSRLQPSLHIKVVGEFAE